MIIVQEVYYIKDNRDQYLREFSVNAGRINKTFVNIREQARAFLTLELAETFNDYPELSETIVKYEVQIDTDNLEDTTGEAEWVILDDQNFYLQVFNLSEGLYTKCFNEDFTVRRRFTTLASAESLNANPKLGGIVAKVTEVEVVQP